MLTEPMLLSPHAVTGSIYYIPSERVGLESTTGSRAVNDLPALRREAEPLVVHQARQCIEQALSAGTSYAGTRLEGIHDWRLEEAPGAILLATRAADRTESVVLWGIRPESATVLHLGVVEMVKRATGLSNERVSRLLGVSRQSLDLWRRGKPISDENRRRLFAVQEILERAARHHPTPEALRAWLDTPRGSEGLTPAELLERGEIGRVRALAMSTPSTLLRLGWANRPIAAPFRTGTERESQAVPPDRDHDFAEYAADDGEEVETVMED